MFYFLKSDIFDQKKCMVFTIYGKKHILFWQNEDVNMFIGSNINRMKFIALVAFEWDYFFLRKSKIQDGRHINMQIRWPLTLTHFFILNGHWWSLVTISPHPMWGTSFKGEAFVAERLKCRASWTFSPFKRPFHNQIIMAAVWIRFYFAKSFNDHPFNIVNQL